MKPLSTLLALLLSCGTAHAVTTGKPDTSSPDVEIARPIEIVRSEFGRFDISQSGEPVFVPATTIPLKAGQGYGWVMLLNTRKAKVKWREEFTLPEAPEAWDGEVEPNSVRSISEDRRVAVTVQEVEPSEGVILHSWAVAPGDPTGRYVIRVIVDGSIEEVFEFDVE